MLDISTFDRKRLYEMRMQLSYMQGQANLMADMYTDDSEEADAVGTIGLRFANILDCIDNILMPD